MHLAHAWRGPDGGTAGDAGAGRRGWRGAGIAGCGAAGGDAGGVASAAAGPQADRPADRERERVVRQFAAFTGCWPWQWTAAQAEAWVASGGWAHSTVRSYEGALALFLEYVCDPRYGWVSECEQRAGAVPVQVFHERNTAAHVCEQEGRAERRPLTRAELQAFFAAADD